MTSSTLQILLPSSRRPSTGDRLLLDQDWSEAERRLVERRSKEAEANREAARQEAAAERARFSCD